MLIASNAIENQQLFDEMRTEIRTTGRGFMPWGLTDHDGAVTFIWIPNDILDSTLASENNYYGVKSAMTYLIIESCRAFYFENGFTKYEKIMMLHLWKASLVNGPDLNRPLMQGVFPLAWIMRFDLDFLLFALEYGADPFRQYPHSYLSDKVRYRSALKIADLYHPQHKELIVKFFTRPVRSVSDRLRIESYKIFSKDNEYVAIHYKTNKNPLTIKIQNTNTLTEEQIKFILSKYKNHFTGSSSLQGTIENFFHHEIAGSNQLIELIWSDNNFIGMHLHRLIIDPKYPNYFSHYLSCAYLDASFRNYGTFDPLMLTLPAIMPKLFSDRATLISMQAINPVAAKLVAGLEYFPKFQPPHLINYAKDLFKHVQDKSDSDPNPELIMNEPGECWSQIPVKSLISIPKQIPPSDKVINHQRAIYDDTELQMFMHRAVFIIACFDAKTMKKFKTSCVQMDLNPEELMDSLPSRVANLIPNLKPKLNPAKVYLPKHASLFRQNQIIPSKTYIPAAKSFTSKL